MGYQTVEKVLK